MHLIFCGDEKKRVGLLGYIREEMNHDFSHHVQITLQIHEGLNLWKVSQYRTRKQLEELVLGCYESK